MSNFLKPGMLFADRYELLEVLGAGGIGTVFKARQTDFKRLIALKVLHADIAGDNDIRTRFLREAKALNEIHHPNVVTVYHIGTGEGDLPFMAMELIEGVNVRKLLNQGSPMPSCRALNLIKQAASALGCAHQSGIIHRDLKPDNLVVVDKPEPDTLKVIDFGLVRLLTEASITNVGTLIGSVSYMSPEQSQGNKVDQRSDIYSLTVCLYEMLTGKTAFEADTPVGIMYKQINEPLPPVTAAEVDRFHPELNVLLSRGMAKDPEKRFQSMQELLASLEKLSEVLAGVSLQDRQSTARLLPAWSALLKGAAIILILSGVTAAAVLYLQQLRTARATQAVVSKGTQNYVNSGKRITLSTATELIQTTRHVDDAAAIKAMDSYLKSRRIEQKAKALLLAVSSKKLLPSSAAALARALEAQSIALTEYRRYKDEASLGFYLSCAANYLDHLAAAGHPREVMEKAESLVALSESKQGFEDAVYKNHLSPAFPTDFLVLAIEAAIDLKDFKKANSLMDSLLVKDRGSLVRAEPLGKALLRLQRSRDLRFYVDRVAGSFCRPQIAIEANVRRYPILCFMKIARDCQKDSQQQLAQHCLDQCDRLLAAMNADGEDDAPLTIHLGLTRADLLFETGDQKSGRKQLQKLCSWWLSRTASQEKANPILIISALLEHGLNKEADDILQVITPLADQYCADLNLGAYGSESFAQNRDYWAEKLNHFKVDHEVQGFVKSLKSLKPQAKTSI